MLSRDSNRHRIRIPLVRPSGTAGAVKIADDESSGEMARGVEEYVPTVDRNGKIIAVASTKGGVGKSTLAANLAYALGKRVLLMDLDFPYSTLSCMLRMYPKRTWKDWRGWLGEIVNPVRETVYLVGNPPDTFLRPKMSDVQEALMQAKRDYHFCVIDCGSRSDEYTKEILKMADRVLVVTSVDQMSLRNNLLFVREMDTPAKVEWVINRLNGKMPFKIAELEQESRTPVAIVLPESKDVLRFTIQGELLVERKPRAAWSKRLQKYADAVAGRV